MVTVTEELKCSSIEHSIWCHRHKRTMTKRLISKVGFELYISRFLASCSNKLSYLRHFHWHRQIHLFLVRHANQSGKTDHVCAFCSKNDSRSSSNAIVQEFMQFNRRDTCPQILHFFSVACQSYMEVYSKMELSEEG
jgi:hypothetical protein